LILSSVSQESWTLFQFLLVSVRLICTIKVLLIVCHRVFNFIKN
jgi:hypothetical protein